MKHKDSQLIGILLLVIGVVLFLISASPILIPVIGIVIGLMLIMMGLQILGYPSLAVLINRIFSQLYLLFKNKYKK